MRRRRWADQGVVGGSDGLLAGVLVALGWAPLMIVNVWSVIAARTDADAAVREYLRVRGPTAPLPDRQKPDAAARASLIASGRSIRQSQSHGRMRLPSALAGWPTSAFAAPLVQVPRISQPRMAHGGHRRRRRGDRPVAGNGPQSCLAKQGVWHAPGEGTASECAPSPSAADRSGSSLMLVPAGVLVITSSSALSQSTCRRRTWPSGGWFRSPSVRRRRRRPAR
ncbi:MAG: hypothetical protein IPN02_18820 [Candidatus Microthrix sp.]|uniref:Uncharacterized protein n=1 Tax=Candidatus Neomicrothrix subdominans TaxID=2954438 RepID=A0A936NFS5_9ACTN|nr:hypothetical protein [Candidatus Microthrix subdominans]